MFDVPFRSSAVAVSSEEETHRDITVPMTLMSRLIGGHLARVSLAETSRKSPKSFGESP